MIEKSECNISLINENIRALTDERLQIVNELSAIKKNHHEILHKLGEIQLQCTDSAINMKSNDIEMVPIAEIPTFSDIVRQEEAAKINQSADLRAVPKQKSMSKPVVVIKAKKFGTGK